MECPKCKKPIECKFSIKTENEKLPIETDYQWWQCKACGTKYYALLEESKINIFDDRLEHQGFIADDKKWEESLKWAKKCPNPKNASCQCSVHQNIHTLEFSGLSAWYSYD